MTDAEFAAWRAESIVSYGAEKVRAGNWTEAEAPALAESSFQELLPDGPATPGHHQFALEREGGGVIGSVWIHLKPGPQRVAYIYDFVIDPDFRGQGYAKSALAAAEREMRRLGAKTSALHVFGHNAVARRLYESTGYVVTNLNMAKELGSIRPDPIESKAERG
jgi:ribosomal protein S18 acetylase RimI-like enzyme